MKNYTKLPKSIIGKECTILTGFLSGEWGIIRMVDEDGYLHVSPYGSQTEALIFEPREVKIKK